MGTKHKETEHRYHRKENNIKITVPKHNGTQNTLNTHDMREDREWEGS